KGMVMHSSIRCCSRHHIVGTATTAYRHYTLQRVEGLTAICLVLGFPVLGVGFLVLGVPSRPQGRTPRFTCAGATDVVPRHRTPLPGVRCKRLLGPALARGPDPSPRPLGGRGRPMRGRLSQYGICCLGLVSWPVLVLC